MHVMRLDLMISLYFVLSVGYESLTTEVKGKETHRNNKGDDIGAIN